MDLEGCSGKYADPCRTQRHSSGAHKRREGGPERSGSARRGLGKLDLNGAELGNANLSMTSLFGAHLSGAYPYWADLSRAELTWADLSGADLHGADLSGADLIGTDLHGADLGEAKLSGTLYEPMRNPSLDSVARAVGLDHLSWLHNSGPIFALHKSLLEAGFRDAAKQLTAAIHRHDQKLWERFFFDWTCEWGSNWLRPLELAALLSLFCTVIY